jgi:steroid 5-alpha reductase family enzyme
MTIIVSSTVTEPNLITPEDIWIPIISVFIANGLLFFIA